MIGNCEKRVPRKWGRKMIINSKVGEKAGKKVKWQETEKYFAACET